MDGVAEVAGGRVQGARRDGVWLFAGVPFAQPPVGPLRWRSAQPVVPWSGVRPAVEFGHVAPQPPPVPGIAIPGDPDDQNEDCLYLNVWTPALDGRARPVMVWIHGGGFTSGSGASRAYRGSQLASRGDVVVVTLNYRLGALGFLAHRALHEGEAAGNWGLGDQIAALQWVRDHIAAFGGDPNNVTAFGESAGGISIAALLAIPSGRGLFHKAVIQSGPPFARTLAEAQESADDLVAQLGLEEPDRERLGAVPASDLVAAAQVLQNRLPRPGTLPLPFLPCVDGTFLPQEPLAAVAAGSAAGVPLMIGTTRDETSLFSLGDPRVAALDRAGLIRWVGRAISFVDPVTFVERYERARVGRSEPTDARQLWIAMSTDLLFRWPSVRLASAQHAHESRTYLYLFTQETPAFGGILGSCHALDVPFVFGGVRDPVIAAYSGGGEQAEQLSEWMGEAWCAFARSGDPSVQGTSPWNAWEPLGRPTMVLGPELGMVDGPRNEELALFDVGSVPSGPPERSDRSDVLASLAGSPSDLPGT